MSLTPHSDLYTANLLLKISIVNLRIKEIFHILLLLLLRSKFYLFFIVSFQLVSIATCMYCSTSMKYIKRSAHTPRKIFEVFKYELDIKKIQILAFIGDWNCFMCYSHLYLNSLFHIFILKKNLEKNSWVWPLICKVFICFTFRHILYFKGKIKSSVSE